MGYRLPSAPAAVINNAASLAAETILTTTGALVPVADSAFILILWYFTLLIGTAGTAVTVRLRRGTTLTGAIINTPTAVTVTAGNTVVFNGFQGDVLQPQGITQYSLTAQVTAATANSPLGDVAHLAISF